MQPPRSLLLRPHVTGTPHVKSGFQGALLLSSGQSQDLKTLQTAGSWVANLEICPGYGIQKEQNMQRILVFIKEQNR